MLRPNKPVASVTHFDPIPLQGSDSLHLSSLAVPTTVAVTSLMCGCKSTLGGTLTRWIH